MFHGVRSILYRGCTVICRHSCTSITLVESIFTNSLLNGVAFVKRVSAAKCHQRIGSEK